jgi:hypothetical protein
MAYRHTVIARGGLASSNDWQTSDEQYEPVSFVKTPQHTSFDSSRADLIILTTFALSFHRLSFIGFTIAIRSSWQGYETAYRTVRGKGQ